MQEANTSPLSMMSTQSALSRLESIDTILPALRLRVDTPSFGHYTPQLTFVNSPLCGKTHRKTLRKVPGSSEIRGIRIGEARVLHAAGAAPDRVVLIELPMHLS